MRHLGNKKGQSTLEYAILIAVITAGLLVVQGYVKRGIQGRLKASTDDIGEQFSPGSLSGTLTTTSNKNYTENKNTTGKTTTVTNSQSQLTSGTVNMKTKLADDPWPE